MSELFQVVVSQFQSSSQYQKFIKECEKQFDVKVYRLGSFTAPYARKIHSELSEKYREKALEVNASGWYENERRLFVWFVLCFMHYKVLDAARFVDSHDKYWRALADTFWHKEVYFLKYQLLNICKAKGRTVWRPREDELLRKVFRQFKLGEWNEVAKEFYRQSGGEYFKTPKQCRQRWQNHLNEGIRKGEWTREEDLAIFEFIAKNGRKNWAQIVKDLHDTRTEHMIKNRYKSLTSRLIADRSISEQEALQAILDGLHGQQVNEEPAYSHLKKKAGSVDDDEIEQVESEMVEESEVDGEGEKKVEEKSPPRREPEPLSFSLFRTPIFASCNKSSQNLRMDPFVMNPFNSQFASSYLNFDASRNFRFPSDIGKDGRYTFFDPNESLNSLKNPDSVIIKPSSDS